MSGFTEDDEQSRDMHRDQREDPLTASPDSGCSQQQQGQPSPSRQGRRVTFKDTVDEFYFERTIIFDRFPTDIPMYPLGMNMWAFEHLTPPLAEERTGPRCKPPRAKMPKREELLLPVLSQIRTDEDQVELIAQLHEDLKKIHKSRRHVGCRCKGGVCHPDTCQCRMAGIDCCHRKLSRGRSNCACLCVPTRFRGLWRMLNTCLQMVAVLAYVLHSCTHTQQMPVPSERVSESRVR